MDTAWIALIGTLFGGVVLKITESTLSKGNQKIDAATSMREELRKDQKELRDQLRVVDHELDMWKEKYFVLLADYLELKSQVPAPVKKEDKVDDW